MALPPGNAAPLSDTVLRAYARERAVALLRCYFPILIGVAFLAVLAAFFPTVSSPVANQGLMSNQGPNADGTAPAPSGATAPIGAIASTGTGQLAGPAVPGSRGGMAGAALGGVDQSGSTGGGSVRAAPLVSSPRAGTGSGASAPVGGTGSPPGHSGGRGSPAPSCPIPIPRGSGTPAEPVLAHVTTACGKLWGSRPQGMLSWFAAAGLPRACRDRVAGPTGLRAQPAPPPWFDSRLWSADVRAVAALVRGGRGVPRDGPALPAGSGLGTSYCAPGSALNHRPDESLGTVSGPRLVRGGYGAM